MAKFRITYSTPSGTEREVIEANTLQEADEIATERAIEAWSDKCWAFADEITDAEDESAPNSPPDKEAQPKETTQDV